MEFRFREGDPPLELTDDQFFDLVAQGKVGPTSQFREPWTGGLWWTVDNLPQFLRASAVRFPPGERIYEVQQIQQRLAESHARAEAIVAMAYQQAVARVYRLEPLEVLAQGSGVAGAARLLVDDTFAPECFVTVVFGSSAVQIECARGPSRLMDAVWKTTQAQEEHPDEEPEQQKKRKPRDPFSYDDVRRSRRSLRYRWAPGIFRTWMEFSTAVRKAPPCDTGVREGTRYQHDFVGPGRSEQARWVNPSPKKHLTQLAVINAYDRLLETAGLGGLKDGPIGLFTRVAAVIRGF
jgi:hypothetical protein